MAKKKKKQLPRFGESPQEMAATQKCLKQQRLDPVRKRRRELMREVVQGKEGVLQTVHGGLDPRNLVPLPHVEGDGRIKIVLSPSSRKMSPAEQERNDQKLIALARRVARRR